MNTKKQIAILVLLFLSITFYAQEGINYKAIIKDDVGNIIVNKTIDVRFTIFEGPIGIFEETHTVTTDTNGLIILNIGEGTAITGDFSTINWSNNNHSMATEIDINQDGSYIYMGSTSFKSVPYALHANSVSAESIKIDDLEDGKSDDGFSFFLGKDAGLSAQGAYEGVVGIGAGALKNTTADHNTAVGSNAGFSNTLGGDNSFFGNLAGFNNTEGSQNVAIGAFAFKDSRLGSRNVAIGTYAGSTNIIEDRNGCVFIGHRAGQQSTGDDKLYIHNGSTNFPLIYGEFNSRILGFHGNLAIGHREPLAKLHVKHFGIPNTQTIVAILESDDSKRPTLLFSETENPDVSSGMSLEYNGIGSGGENKLIFNGIGGTPLFEFKNSGDFNILDGDLAVDGLTMAKNTIGTEPDLILGGNSSSADNGFITSDPQFTSSDIVIQSNDAVSIRLDNDNNETGQFQIINGDNSVVFEVLESGIIKQNSTTIHSSDRRLKKDIEILPYGLKEVLQLQPKTYNWKNRDQAHKSLGLIAQEVQPIIKEIVSVNNDTTKTLGISYTELIPILINAIKEQAHEIGVLKKTYNNRIKRLEEHLVNLEN